MNVGGHLQGPALPTSHWTGIWWAKKKSLCCWRNSNSGLPVYSLSQTSLWAIPPTNTRVGTLIVATIYLQLIQN